jgi:DNA primase small subunit
LTDTKHPAADPQFLTRREFCFTLDGDIFVRYKSFKVRPCYHPAACPDPGQLLDWLAEPVASLVVQDHQELTAALRKSKPAKIDIGPVYNIDPQRRHAYNGQLLPHNPNLLPLANSTKQCPAPKPSP